jgi:hypothetical protein
MTVTDSDGNRAENIKNTNPILNALPVITKVVLIPAATPLLFGDTEFMMVALLGDVNIPIPAPINASGNIASAYEIVEPIVVNITNPIAETINPA